MVCAWQCYIAITASYVTIVHHCVAVLSYVDVFTAQHCAVIYCSKSGSQRRSAGMPRAPGGSAAGHRRLGTPWPTATYCTVNLGSKCMYLLWSFESIKTFNFFKWSLLEIELFLKHFDISKISIYHQSHFDNKIPTVVTFTSFLLF